MVTDYLYVYKDFVKDRLDSLVTKYCYKYKIYGNRQLNVKDEVISDIGLTFCYKCKYCLDIPRNVDFITYMALSLTRHVEFSILKQLRYYRNCKKDSAYYLQKFGKFSHGQIIDLRIKDPSQELFRLSYDDFNFSPLNKNEKKIIELYFWKNLKISEISEILNINESAVRQSKKRALKKLKNLNIHLLN